MRESDLPRVPYFVRGDFYAERLWEIYFSSFSQVPPFSDYLISNRLDLPRPLEGEIVAKVPLPLLAEHKLGPCVQSSLFPRKKIVFIIFLKRVLIRT